MNRPEWRTLSNFDIGERIIHVYASWAGTPYMAGQRAKHIGVDCIQLVGGVLDELYRYPKPSHIPRLPRTSGMNSPLAGFRTSMAIRKQYPMAIARDGRVEPGDVLVTQCTRDNMPSRRLMGHAVLVGVTPGTFLHATPSNGVCWASWASLPPIVRIYRLREKQTWL